MASLLIERPSPLAIDRHGLRACNDSTFEAFYKAEYDSVVGLCCTLYGNRNTAEDLAQEAFVEAHRHWPNVGRYDRPDAWVRQVLINKSRSRQRRVVSETKALNLLGGRRREVTELPEPSAGVWAAVGALPQRQAQVIALRYWDGLGIDEIAKVLGCGSETVKTHLKRAKAKLTANLTAERNSLAA